MTAAPVGLVLGQSKRLYEVTVPSISLLHPIPKVVLVPVILLVLGVGELPKIVIVATILFFQILVLVRDAAAAIQTELLTSVRSLGAGRRALLTFVYLPASLPAIFTAVRQSIGTAVAVLYVAELFATRLGYYIYLQRSTLFDYPHMYAGNRRDEYAWTGDLLPPWTSWSVDSVVGSRPLEGDFDDLRVCAIS